MKEKTGIDSFMLHILAMTLMLRSLVGDLIARSGMADLCRQTRFSDFCIYDRRGLCPYFQCEKIHGSFVCLCVGFRDPI